MSDLLILLAIIASAILVMVAYAKYVDWACEHNGHKWETKRVRIYKDTDDWAWVVEEWYADMVRCKRCGLVEDVKPTEFIRGYTGFSAPESIYNAIKEEGCYVIDQ